MLNPRPLLGLAAFSFSLPTPAHAQIWEGCNVVYQLDGEAPGSLYGFVGRRAGLVDGDSAQDIVIGAPGANSGAGKAYVYSGSSGALLFTLDGAGTESVGQAVGSAGDLNGDGFSEVLVGAPGGPGPGSAYVLDGATGGVLLTLSAGFAGDGFGSSVDTAGDVDGDGVPDILVGANFDDQTANNAGRVYLYSGASGVLLREHPGEAVGDQLGSALGTIGDRNQDGRGDYVVCALNGGPGNRGKAWVYDGMTGQLVGSPLLPTSTGSVYGQYFAGLVGDVDGDGTQDFFVSDWGDRTNGSTSGKTYVYSGADLSLIMAPTGDRAGDAYGIGRGYAGDVDGDGLDDLFMAAFLAADGGASAGKGIVHSAATQTPYTTYHGNVPQAALGFDADGLGDVTGDGVPDFLLTSTPGNGFAIVVSGAPTPPHSFCESNPNSTGVAAKLTYRRSLGVADNEGRLRVIDAIPGAPGLFFYGKRAIQAPFGDGVRCVGGQTFRLAPSLTLNTLGRGVRDLDFSQGPLGSGPGQILPGGTWYFQFWYRDMAAGGTGFNLSNGLEVTFCP